MSESIAIAVGGAAGSVLRYWSSLGVHAWAGRGFPYGTLAVNVLGCLVMGLLYVWLIERSGAGPTWRAGLLVGLLGGFTTFSSFSIETVNLFEGGEPARAALNVALSVALCLLGTWLGVALGRQL
jgi:CrcB protein